MSESDITPSGGRYLLAGDQKWNPPSRRSRSARPATSPHKGEVGAIVESATLKPSHTLHLPLVGEIGTNVVRAGWGVVLLT